MTFDKTLWKKRWRSLQQTYTYHAIQAAILGSLGTLFTCFQAAHGFTHDCLMTFLFFSGGAFAVSIQHGPGSANYLPDGDENKLVTQAAEIAKTDPEAAKVGVIRTVETPDKLVTNP